MSNARFQGKVAAGAVMRGLKPSHWLVVLGVAASAVACNQRGDVTSTIPADYRQRHPIVLTQGNETLDIFVGHVSGRLDRRQQEDVRAFARDYMQNGQGPLIAYLPTGGHTAGVSQGLNGIRQALAGGGASGRLQIAHYQGPGGNAAPIKLAFAKLKAETTTRCGYENQDIQPSRLSTNILNESPHNFGCTYQKNLAAQVADPRDLVRPRDEGPIDVDKRLGGIERIREAESNELKFDGKSLKQIGSQ
jgi:pilus assembly protein CpaD